MLDFFYLESDERCPSGRLSGGSPIGLKHKSAVSEQAAQQPTIETGLILQAGFYSVSPSAKLRPRLQGNGIYDTSSKMQPASCRFGRQSA